MARRASRKPMWVREEIETLGKQVLNGDLEREEAAELLNDEIFDRDKDFLRYGIGRPWTRRELKKWINEQVRSGGTSGRQDKPDGSHQPELFPYLPRVLETSPGRFAHINSMTKHDWDAAKRQAEVKESNTRNYADNVRRAYDEVIPLLTEDWMTTSDIADQIG